VALLDELIDEVGDDENSPLASLMETLGALIETYEAGALPEPAGDPLTSLRALLADHDLGPADLPELGDPATAMDILQGRRDLSLAQIRRLVDRFGVSPAVFV
jgi:HTH-type transcriptional regulator/antitoxin HigA